METLTLLIGDCIMEQNINRPIAIRNTISAQLLCCYDLTAFLKGKASYKNIEHQVEVGGWTQMGK